MAPAFALNAGAILFHVHHRYVERGLADIICDEPLAARLKFEPRGRGNADDNYYLVRDSVRSQPRSNQLVSKRVQLCIRML